MLAEIDSLTSSAAATAWANTMLRAKNTLTAEDARAVEAAFESKFAGLATDLAALEPMPDVGAADSHGIVPDGGPAEPPASDAGDLTDRKLPITKTVLHRNKEHLKFVRGQPCLVCGRQPSDPHHLRFAAPRALGRKVSDEFTVPLCRVHHREAHRTTKEMSWWQALGIAPLEVARGLWQKTQSGRSAARAPTARRTQEPSAAPPIQPSLPSADADGAGTDTHKPLPADRTSRLPP